MQLIKKSKTKLKKKAKQKKKKTVLITAYNQIKIEQKNPNIIMDFSKLPKSTDKRDIQNYDLSDLDLNINLRNLWVPFYREKFHLEGKIERNEVFLHLNHANLKGNNVTGNLSPFYDERYGSVYFWYNENTFDAQYKEEYPEYFLDDKAPQELKDKFYNPKIKEVYKGKLKEEKKEEDFALERQTLTLKEYIKYYPFLRGKYLGNFKIEKTERAKIAFIDYFGLKNAKEKLEKLSKINLSLNEILEILKNTDVTKWNEWFERNAFIYEEYEEEATKLR